MHGPCFPWAVVTDEWEGKARVTFDPRLQRGLWDAFQLSGSETVAVNQIERLSLTTVALGPKPALPGPYCFVAAVCVLARKYFLHSTNQTYT